MPANKTLVRAWVGLCLALALHVLDEALTGFLAVYNPSVEALRAQLPWLRLPTFTFDIWLTGLILGIVLMALAAIPVFRGARWTRPVAYLLAVMMIFNGLAHLAATALGRTFGSVTLAGPMPGVYSSPLLVAASVYLLYSLRQTAVTK